MPAEHQRPKHPEDVAGGPGEGDREAEPPPTGEGNRALSDLDRNYSDADLSASDADQLGADSDQSASDADQATSDRDQQQAGLSSASWQRMRRLDESARMRRPDAGVSLPDVRRAP
jgi:hypothetical protein